MRPNSAGRPHCLKFATVALALIGVFLVAPPGVEATPTAQHPGKWTPAKDFSGIDSPAVHMLLVPDSTGSYHSKIVWWQSEGSVLGVNGRTMGWRPNDQYCGATVDSALTDLGTFSNSPFNIFCAGQIQFGQHILVIGGTDGSYEIGTPNSAQLNPGLGSWSHMDAMEYRRWYPSTTALADSSILVSGGITYPHMMLFGGRVANQVRSDSLLRLYELTSLGGWDAPHGTSGDPVNRPTWPDSRSGQSLSSVLREGSLRDWMFGGEHEAVGGGGAIDTTYLNDEWAISRDENETDPDFGYSFYSRLAQ